MSRGRRSSILETQISEPLIVVEENGDSSEKFEKGVCSSEESSPTMNQFLLTPFARDIRKQSLPTPQCSGITASQVRRLSERNETVGPGPRQAEFLATLSQAPQQTPGGRRHSVVTISRVPPVFFGRSRRESVAIFPSRVLPNRRESFACPPSEPLGSAHNLHLDIMDDIVQARKVRMKLWSNSNEKVCEVQPINERDSEHIQIFHGSRRRYSDFVGTTLASIPNSIKRRESTLHGPSSSKSSNESKPKSSGIVCSNTDLLSILSSLSTSAMEINQQYENQTGREYQSQSITCPKSKSLQNTRSNSFDIAMIYNAKTSRETDEANTTPSNWLTKRHQPKKRTRDTTSGTFTPYNEENMNAVCNESEKVVWDGKSGSMVDANALGSAIEVFLQHVDPSESTAIENIPMKFQEKKKNHEDSSRISKSSWFPNRSDDDSAETCDSSICTTLKDLFVKPSVSD